MTVRSGAMMSKVGNPQLYEDGDQRMPKQKHKDHPKKHDQQDDYEDIESEDERGIGKKIAALDSRAQQLNMSNPPRADPKVDPLGPATSHGNEPSKGAKIDAEIKQEEEELLRRKGKA